MNNPATMDPLGIRTLLLHAALVIVPVVNPDGYQFSHTTNRDQRMNRRNTGCSDPNANGVDINRNYGGNWGGVGADNVSTMACQGGIYEGPSANSEIETEAMETLLNGVWAGVRTQAGAVSVSYHTYSDVTEWPNGYKATFDAHGPQCLPDFNCLNPDFEVYRGLFGDTRTPFLTDQTTSANRPYQSDMEESVAYTTTGDFSQYSNFFATTKMPSVTIELNGNTDGTQPLQFYPECLTSPQIDTLLAQLFSQQQLLVQKFLGFAPSLSGAASTVASTAFASSRYGTLGGGLLLREITNQNDVGTPRPHLMVTKWRVGDPGTPFSLSGDGIPRSFVPARTGSQLNVYSWTPPAANALTIPCKFTSGEDSITCLGGMPVNLCDPNRFVVSPPGSWTLMTGNRGTPAAPDCWWQPNQSATTDAVLQLNGGGLPSGVTSCHLSFTTQWTAPNAPGLDNPLLLERQTGATWQSVTQWPFLDPVSDFRWFSTQTGQLRSYFIEAAQIPGSQADTFRFRLPAASSGVNDFKLFDAVVYCRSGALP